MMNALSRGLGKARDLLLGAVTSYFVAFFLNRFVFSGPREVKVSSAVVSIDRPGPHWDLFAVYIVSVIVVVLLILFIRRSRQGEPYGGWKLVRILLISISVPVVLLIISHFFIVARVGAKMEIRGRAHDAKRYYYLFVRPVFSSRCWLQEPVPLRPGHDGIWRAGSYFGGHRGERFELIAIASKSRLDPDPFNMAGGYSCNEIPNEVESFVREVKLE
jgi:hypothetical protein